MEDLTGRQFGPYHIVSPCGEGGMAAVFKAYQASMDRYVAIKVLPRFHSANPEFVDRFKQEAQVLAKLQHPYIVPIHDFGEADGYTYLVMPFIKSGTLANLLIGKPIPLSRINQIIAQVGDALDYAHSLGLIHRDIKPSNILVDERGNCMLTDFGIAKILEGSAEFTKSGGILGTPTYMSPEQGSGNKVDHKSDIYSLGVILYEMTTGRVPFEAETPVAVIFKHVHDPLPPPSIINPEIDEDVERVVLKSLAKNPEDRFESAKGMVEALMAAVRTYDYRPQLDLETPPTIKEPLPPTAVQPPEVLEPELPPPEKPEEELLRGPTAIEHAVPVSSSRRLKINKLLLYGALVVIVGAISYMLLNWDQLGISGLIGRESSATQEVQNPTEDLKVSPDRSTSEAAKEIANPTSIDPTSIPELEPTEASMPELGSEEYPIKVLFAPLGDVDFMIESGDLIAQALNENAGLFFDVGIPTSYAATIEEMCASREDTIGFIPAMGYVMANSLCGVTPGLASVRYGWNFYWTQYIVPRDSPYETLQDLEGATWAHPGISSTSGYIYPKSIFDELGITIGDTVEANNHLQVVRDVYNGEADFGTCYFSPPLLPESMGTWDPKTMEPDIPDEYVDECGLNEEHQLYCGEYRVLDARAAVSEELPDVVQKVRILDISPEIPNDTMSFSPDFPDALKKTIMDAVVAYVNSEACQEALCNEGFYDWMGAAPIFDENFDGIRIMMEQQGITLENIDG
jgi:phosphonate transport system substrate-binding protein